MKHNAIFLNALRECLGMGPLHQDGRSETKNPAHRMGRRKTTNRNPPLGSGASAELSSGESDSRGRQGRNGCRDNHLP